MKNRKYKRPDFLDLFIDPETFQVTLEGKGIDGVNYRFNKDQEDNRINHIYAVNTSYYVGGNCPDRRLFETTKE